MNALAPIGAAQPMLPLVLPETSTFEEWSSLGRLLVSGRRKLDFLTGDWLIRGSTEYGDKARSEANAIFRADVERFGPMLDVCRRFPETRRHEALTFGHHLAVMPVEDDEQAEAILVEAETNRMTVAAVKAQVRVTTNRQTTILPDDDPEDTAYRRIVQAWNRAPRGVRKLFQEQIEETGLKVIDL